MNKRTTKNFQPEPQPNSEPQPMDSTSSPDIGNTNVSSRLLLKKHERCIEILEAIQSFENRIKHLQYSVNGIAGFFPELRQKYINNIDTLERCINRLHLRYRSVLNGC